MNAIEIAQAVNNLNYSIRRTRLGDNIVLTPRRPGDTRQALLFKSQQDLVDWLVGLNSPVNNECDVNGYGDLSIQWG